jgi:hypothetical protein
LEEHNERSRRNPHASLAARDATGESVAKPDQHPRDANSREADTNPTEAE